MSHRPGPAALWIVLLLLHASISLFLIADRRMERGAAARAIQEREQAALSGGTGAGGGLFVHAIRLPMVPREGAGAPTLFHLGLFFEELIFLLGVWLLSRSLFEDPRTSFFAAAAALGASLWAGNADLSLRTVFALPLLAHLLRDFLREGSPWLLFGAINFAALQALGQPAATALLAPLAAVLAVALLPRSAGAFRPDRRHAAAVAAGLATAIPVLVESFRNPAPSPPLSWGAANLLDLVLGLAPSQNGSLFCGFLTLAFAILGLARATRKVGILLLAALAAGAVSPVGAPLLRLGLVLLAAAGFDAALRERRPGPRAVGAAFLVLAAALAGLSLRISSLPDLPERAARLFAPGHPEALSPIFGSAAVCDLLDTSALWAGTAGGLLLLLVSRTRTVPLAIALILFLHPLEILSWKFRMTWTLTAPVEAAAWAAQRIPAGGGPRTDAAGLILGLNAAAWLLLVLRKCGELRRR